MMRRLLVVAVSVATVIAMAPGIGASEPRQDPVLADTEAREVLPATNHDVYMCEAPSTPTALLEEGPEALPAECHNGEFTRDSTGITHGFTGVPYAEEGWTGTFESWLVHEGDDRGFQCTFDNGELLECQGLGGQWPGFDVPFEHVCYAYETETGLPIATHDWGCSISGEPLTPL